jgi:hypothetical protein
LKVAIYTPTYRQSPGTRYKVDMLVKALSAKHEATLVCEEDESLFRRVYRLLGPSLLNWGLTWASIGRRIGGRLLPLHPDAAVLVTDVTAGAIPILKASGVRTILSIEDLTPVWLHMSNAEPFYRQLASFSRGADGVIAVSEHLREKLLQMGIPSQVVPHGIERMQVDEGRARERAKQPVTVLNAGQLVSAKERNAFRSSMARILPRYRVMSYSFGKQSQKLKKDFPDIDWYSFASPAEAARHLVSASVGLVIRFNTERPTRIFYHASMLQPMVAVGDGWVDEVARESIGLVSSPEGALEAVDAILGDYGHHVGSVRAYAERNLLPAAYAPLMKMLG